MALDRDHDFIDMEDEAEARRDARRVTLLGVSLSLVLGAVLVSALMYGRVLTDDAGAALHSPPALVTSNAPKQGTP